MRSRLFVAFLLAPLIAAYAVPALSQDSSAEGERLFRTRCGTCHSVEPGQNRVGPTLASVMGRTAGTVEGARYSPGMRSSAIVWDEKTLDGYLANPRGTVSGTTMLVALANGSERERIIAYLVSRSAASR